MIESELYFIKHFIKLKLISPVLLKLFPSSAFSEFLKTILLNFAEINWYVFYLIEGGVLS